MGYIYKILNTVNDKCYNGQTRQADVKQRWREHISRALRGNNGCCAIGCALKKYGTSAFQFHIVCVCFDDDLKFFEPHYIKSFNSLTPSGYNLTEGGEGYTMSDRTKQKLSASHTGKKLTEEHKRNLSQAGRGRAVSPETRAKISAGNKGKPKSAEHKRKIGETSRGRKHSEDALRKMSEANKGKSLTEEHRRKIRDALTGKAKSGEHKHNLKDAHARRMLRIEEAYADARSAVLEFSTISTL